jgi:hypothetical protein
MFGSLKMSFVFLAKAILLVFVLSCFLKSNVLAQSTWKGSASNSWTLAGNWTGGVPTAASTVIINADPVNHFPILPGNVTIATLTMTGGSLNLGGATLTVTGTASLSNTAINNGEIRAASISQVTNVTFTNDITLRKTGGTANAWAGGNSFGGATQIINAGSANIVTAGTNGDTFNSSVTFSNFPTNNSSITIGNAGTTTFESAVVINNTASNGVIFGGSGTINLLTGSSFTTSNYATGNFTINNVTQAQNLANGSFGVANLTVSNSTIRGIINFTASGTTSITNSTFENGYTLTSTGAISLASSTVSGAMSAITTNLITISQLNATAGVTLQASNFTVTGPNNFSTLSGSASITKTGGGDANWSGGNTFGNVVITNNGSGHIRLVESGTVGDTFQGNATFNNNPSNNSYIRIARRGANTFGGNITLINSTSTAGILFGTDGGTSTQSAGGVLTSGFTNGLLQLDNFTQQQNVTNGNFNPREFTSKNTVLEGDISIIADTKITLLETQFKRTNVLTAPDIDNNGLNKFSLVGGNTIITKTGGNDNDWVGGNEYGETTIISLSTDKRIRIGNTGGVETFHGNATFQKQAGGEFTVARTSDCIFMKDVSTVGSIQAVDFGRDNNSTGWTRFKGSIPQSFNGANSTSPTVYRMEMDNDKGLTLNVNVLIYTTLQFTDGEIYSSASSLLTFRDKATHSGSSDNSHVNGPVRAEGDDAFVFPIGAPGIIAQIGISNFQNANNSVHFTAEYFRVNPHPTYNPNAKDTTIRNVCSHEYWILDRTNGTPNVEVTLYYAENRSCDYDPAKASEMKVIRWDGAKWIDHGNGGITGVFLNGTIKSIGRVTSFSPFTIGNILPSAVLPIRLKEFTAFEKDGAVEINWTTLSEIGVDYFEVERSHNGYQFQTIATVAPKGSESTTSHYSLKDLRPIIGNNYYRLVEIDESGNRNYFELVKVIINSETTQYQYLLYPNPIGKDNLIYYSGNKAGKVEVYIMDMKGSIVSKASFDTEGVLELPGHLPKGIYIGIIRDPETGKIVQRQRFILD